MLPVPSNTGFCCNLRTKVRFTDGLRFRSTNMLVDMPRNVTNDTFVATNCHSVPHGRYVTFYLSFHPSLLNPWNFCRFLTQLARAIADNSTGVFFGFVLVFFRAVFIRPRSEKKAIQAYSLLSSSVCSKITISGRPPVCFICLIRSLTFLPADLLAKLLCFLSLLAKFTVHPT